MRRLIVAAAAAVRAAAYLVLAAGLLAGIPWALIRFIGWPLPRTVPGGAQVMDWVDDPVGGMRFWKLFAIVFWILWALLIYAVIRELLVLLGRIRAPRIRIRPLHTLTAGMVGTATTLTGAAAHAAPPAAVAAAVPDLDPAAGAQHSDAVYVVEHGDWLSTIAARYLGDADAYPRIVAVNPHLDHRGPHHIERGWRLRLPGDAHDRGIRLHAAGHLTQPATAPPQPPATPPAPAPGPPPTPAPAGSTPTHPPVEAGAAPVDPDGLDGALPDDGEPDVVIVSSRTGAMTGAGLLASLLFAMLTAERRRQRGLFPPGFEPPLPTNGKAERELRAAQQPADVERLDTALRDLTHQLATRPVPDMVGVRLVGGDVNVLLAEPDDDPPPGWLDEGSQWTLPAYIQPTPTNHPPGTEPAGTAQPGTEPAEALLPLLVTIGSRAGRHLLIDLERLGTLAVGGHPYRARDLLRHIVCELACATWSRATTVLLAGYGAEGDALSDINPDRIRPTTLDDAVATVRGELATRSQATDTSRAPMVLIVASPDAAGLAMLADLHRDLVAVGRCRIAIVTTVPDGEPIGVAALTLTDSGTVKAVLPGLRMSTDAASVPPDMLEPMAAVFRAARATTPPPPAAAPVDLPAWDDTIDPADGVLGVFTTSTPPDPAASNGHQATTGAVVAAGSDAVLPGDDPDLDADLAAWRDEDPHRPRIAILGPIQVHLPGPLTDTKRRLYIEMLLYLLTRPDRAATREQIEDALWYGNPAGEGSIRAAISRIRKWLGPRPDHTEWISDNHSPDRIYRLNDGVLLDWHLLLRLQTRARHRGEHGMPDYRAALSLIRGVAMHNAPDHGTYRRPYTWIGDSDIRPGRLLATITDIAHHVATHHLTRGDATTARWAIDQAWKADPDRGTDELWIDRMKAEHLDGHTAALHHLIAEYQQAREAEVLEDLDPRTYQQIHTLLQTTA